MSSATASLRGGAVLPSEMKDLLSKLVAADEGTATCPAVQFQRCDDLDVNVQCTGNTGCNWVGSRFENVPGATEEGSYCTPSLEEDELVEESTELQDDPEQCAVLGSDDGGCVPHGFPGLYCKSGYTCMGYAPPANGNQNPTLGACVQDTNRAVDTRTHATICTQDFYSIGIPCSVNGECHGHWVNPNNCEARCANGVCAAPTFEEEEEELAASDDHDHEGDTYDNVPADAAHCLPSGAACSLDDQGTEVLHAGHKRCCGMTGPDIWTHNGASCNFFNNRHAVTNSDAGAGAYCVYNPGEDLAVN